MCSINVLLLLDVVVELFFIVCCQLVVICCVLVQDVWFIIMDEFMVLLIYQEVEGLLYVVCQLCERGICIVFVSYCLEEVMVVLDCISVLKDGNLVGILLVVEVIICWFGFLMMGQEFDYQVCDLWQGQGSMLVLEVCNFSCKGEYYNVFLKVEVGEVVLIVGLLGVG